jgi:hypothetical protein
VPKAVPSLRPFNRIPRLPALDQLNLWARCLRARVKGSTTWKYEHPRQGLPSSVTVPMAHWVHEKMWNATITMQDRLRDYTSSMARVVQQSVRANLERRDMPGVPDVVREAKNDMMRRAEEMEDEGKTRDNRKRWGRSVSNDRVISRFWRAMAFGWRTGADVEAGRLVVPPPSYTAAGGMLQWDHRRRIRFGSRTPVPAPETSRPSMETMEESMGDSTFSSSSSSSNSSSALFALDPVPDRADQSVANIRDCGWLGVI